MKYWRGYLVAAIFAAISWALVQFAKTHGVLVDMIFPYITRMVIGSMADWTGGMGFCLWQALLVGLVVLGIVSVILMIVLKWNPIQWGGWVLAVICFFSMFNTLIYGLNAYASPLADDVRLQVTDYTVSELDTTMIYFRDKANELAPTVTRDEKGYAALGEFEDLAIQAADGFEALAYDEAISVFAGSTVPVKKLGWSGLYTMRGASGEIFPLTGEAAVNPDVPSAAMPYAMCKEMARRMSIYSEADAGYAAFLAGIHNESPAFQYSAYLMAYKACYEAMSSISTSTAQTCASQADAGVSAQLRQDLEACADFFGKRDVQTNVRTGLITEVSAAAVETTAATTAPATTAPATETTAPAETQPSSQQGAVITFSEYSDVSDLLVSWYIQQFVLPLHQEEETPFNPLDPTQVDLTGIPNAKVG